MGASVSLMLQSQDVGSASSLDATFRVFEACGEQVRGRGHAEQRDVGVHDWKLSYLSDFKHYTQFSYVHPVVSIYSLVKEMLRKGNSFEKKQSLPGACMGSLNTSHGFVTCSFMGQMHGAIRPGALSKYIVSSEKYLTFLILLLWRKWEHGPEFRSAIRWTRCRLSFMPQPEEGALFGPDAFPAPWLQPPWP